MARKSYAQAIADTLYDTLKSDPSVTIVGSYVLGFGPFNPLLNKVRQDFPDRLWDPPIAEAANAYLGIGAAMAGARPMIDFATAAFSYLAWSPMVNEAGVAHYMTGGTVDVPVIFHMLHGIRGGGGPQHSHSPQAMLWNAAGLQLVMPSTPRDVKGLLRSAFRTRNPVVMIDHYKLMGTEGEVPDDDYEIPFGVADVKRSGRDVTVVATSHLVLSALEAADALARDGVEVEVLDPRTLVPFDTAALLKSVERTGRLIVVDECNLRCGVAAEIAAIVAESGFHALKAPVVRVTRPDVPIPFSPPLEEALTPKTSDIVAAVKKLMAAPAKAA
jgi:pyruvate dehydrogenase E1 component beta subunit